MNLRARRGLGIVVTFFVMTAIGCTSPPSPGGPTDTPVDGGRTLAPPSDPGAAERPSGDVPTHTDVLEVEPGDDLQAAAEAAHPGATILLTAGVYREQQVIPRDGQRFIGEPGTILSGARELTTDAFRQDVQGRWYVDAQEQEGLRRGQVGEARPESIRNPEEVFVDGDQRLAPTDDLGDLGPGTFHFDYEADRIYLGDDPRSFEIIETSTTPFAFGGTGVRGVTVENLIVEKYASPVQFGAIGGSPPEQFPYDWTIRRVEARLNHGGGLGIGPGMTIEHADVHDNGQIGIIGHGEDQSNDKPGYSALVTIRDTRIHRNNVLGFQWRHEAGATKFKACTSGFLFEGNWVHDNQGSGPWWDNDNYDTTVRDNLVENNLGAGIFYEISYGSTSIIGNVVRGNGVDDEALAPGIFVSNSEGVEVRGNTVVGSPQGILGISRRDRDPLTTDLHLEDNTVSLPPDGSTGVDFDDPGLVADITIQGNRYHLMDGESAFLWGSRTMDFTGWNQQGWDVDGEIITAPPETDDFARRFVEKSYGPVVGS